MTLELERPLRHPDTGSRPLMDKRARWLVVLGFVLPGSAQLLAGNRRLGRFGLGATIALIVLGLLVVAGLLFARAFTLNVLANPVVLLVLQALIVAYAVLWLVLGFDTLRLTRLVRISPGWRVPVAVLSVLLTVLPVGAAAWAATTVGTLRGDWRSALFVNAAPPVDPVDGRYNILLLGVDMGEDRDGMRPDSISLISVDAETGQSVIVGLPRELTEMPFPETSPMYAVHPNGFCMGPNAFGDYGGCLTRGYLNGIFSEVEVVDDPQYSYLYEGFYPDAVSRGSSPGIEATKDAVTGATGLEVQFYVLIDMQGFADLIDALGGVEIEVAERLPIGGEVDEATGELVGVEEWIEPGTYRMGGYVAEWYARSRYGSAGGDYDRMDRQRQLQAAILAQMDPQNVLNHLKEILDTGSEMVRTDIPDSMLGSFVDLAIKARAHQPVVVQLTPPDVDPEYPDYDYIHRLVASGVAAASPAPDAE